MKKFAVAAAALALLAPTAKAKSDSNPAPTAAQIKAVLEANPDIVLDVLSQNKEKFFAIVKQAAQEVDPQKRADLYKQADRIGCWENPIIIPIYYAISELLIKPRVTDAIINGMGITYRNIAIKA